MDNLLEDYSPDKYQHLLFADVYSELNRLFSFNKSKYFLYPLPIDLEYVRRINENFTLHLATKD